MAFTGTVDLHNLPLKKTALKGLELPLQVKSGFIGHLQLSIPLRRPKSEPWIVHINRLYLVAGPLHQSEVFKYYNTVRCTYLDSCVCIVFGLCMYCFSVQYIYLEVCIVLCVFIF